MALLSTYFDESGIHKDSPIVVVAGIIASTSQWSKFSRKWKKVLDSKGVAAFHMTDFENSRGEFEGWGLERKLPFQLKLIEIIRGHTRLYLSSVVRKEDFEVVIKEYPHLKKTPYQFCCEQSLIILNTWIERSDKRKKLAIFFEKGHPLMTETVELFSNTTDTQWLEEKRLIGSIVHIDKKDCIPLQAADFLTYEIYKNSLNRLSGFVRPPRKSGLALFKDKKYMGITSNDLDSIRQHLDISSEYYFHLKSLVSKPRSLS